MAAITSSYPVAMARAPAEAIADAIPCFSRDLCRLVAGYNWVVIDSIYDDKRWEKDHPGLKVPRLMITQKKALEILKFLCGPDPIDVFCQRRAPRAVRNCWYPGVYVPETVAHGEVSTSFCLEQLRKIAPQSLFHVNYDISRLFGEVPAKVARIVFIRKQHVCRGESWDTMKLSLANVKAGLEIEPGLLNIGTAIYGIRLLTGKCPLGDENGAEGRKTIAQAAECFVDEDGTHWQSNIGGHCPSGSAIGVNSDKRYSIVAVFMRVFELDT